MVMVFGAGPCERGSLAALIGQSTYELRAKRDAHPQARFVKSQDRIAQRQEMARWNRDAESIYKPKELMGRR